MVVAEFQHHWSRARASLGVVRLRPFHKSHIDRLRKDEAKMWRIFIEVRIATANLPVPGYSIDKSDHDLLNKSAMC